MAYIYVIFILFSDSLIKQSVVLGSRLDIWKEKNTMKKRVIPLILCLLLIAVPVYGAEDVEPAIAGTAATETEHEITQKMLTTYVMNETLTSEDPFYFIDGNEGVPYVEMEEWLPAYTSLIGSLFGDMQVSVTSAADGEQYAWIRENDAAMVLDFEEDTISFNNYDAFISHSFASSFIDALALQYYDSEGNPIILERQPDMSFDRPGEPKVFDLASYGIDMICQDGKYYVPLHTIADIAYSPLTNWMVLYNDEAVFYVGDGNIGTSSRDGKEITLTPLGEIYYSVLARERTEEEARYGYAELCMVMDNFYGLKGIHQISDFDTVFTQVGIKDALMSPDAGLADIAWKAFIALYLDDLHSGFGLPSWMVPDDADHEILRTPRSQTKMYNNIDLYEEARQESNPDGVPHYQEIGNTAYITFDQFASPILNGGELIYSLTEEEIEAAALGDPADTIALAVYAHRQINRENSPIENVVLDLSNNIGGGYDIAVFITAWFLGTADIAFQDQSTGALSALAYRADVNLDRIFDEQDCLTDKNLYCLISPVSFSCGNLVPACLKSSQQVTMIGRQSGGGSCSVQYETTAWGTSFKISGHRNISMLKNGSFYDIDQGVVPDYYLSKLSSFYDRVKLTDIINNMD